MSLFSEFDLFRRSVHQLFSEFERDFLNDRYLLDTHFAEYPMLQQTDMDIDNDQANNNNNNNNNNANANANANTNNNNKNNQGAMTATTATNNNNNNNNNASGQQQLQTRRGAGGNSLTNTRYPSPSSVFSSSLSPWSPHSLAVGFRSLPASCKMDVIEKSDRYEVHAELAGIPKENINIEIKDGLLTLTGEKRTEKEQKSANENHQENKDNNNNNNNNNNNSTLNTTTNGPVTQPHYHYRERSYSSVKRSLRLPDNIDQEKICAKYDNGLLEIYLPKKEKQTQKTLNVQIA